MLNRKKIVFFLVEGDTDEIYLSSILNTKEAINREYKFIFIKVKDVTSNFKYTQANIKGELTKIVEKRIKEEAFLRSDIYKIVHLIDIDGAYIDRDNIYVDLTRHFHYEEEGIFSDNVDQVLQRNGHKKKMLRVLIDTVQLNSLPYNLYFMSCNFEHILFGQEKMNATMMEKISLSKGYFAECKKNVFLPQETVLNEDYMCSDYISSWQEIAKGKNSLKRKSNINLFLQDIM